MNITMIFGEKNIVGTDKCYSSKDLFEYLKTLMKESIQQHRRCEERSHYSWLRSRNLNEPAAEHYLEDLKPMISKMSSESCTAIAVKLDELTEERSYTISDLLTVMKKLLQERDSIQNIEKTVQRAKEGRLGRRMNKVHPELKGRQATVSFIVESKMS